MPVSLKYSPNCSPSQSHLYNMLFGKPKIGILKLFWLQVLVAISVISRAISRLIAKVTKFWVSYKR